MSIAYFPCIDCLEQIRSENPFSAALWEHLCEKWVIDATYFELQTPHTCPLMEIIYPGRTDILETLERFGYVVTTESGLKTIAGRLQGVDEENHVVCIRKHLTNKKGPL